MKHKFCVDCKWFEETGKEMVMPWCRSPNGIYDLVTGYPQSLDPYKARQEKNLCGRTAKWFQPK